MPAPVEMMLVVTANFFEIRELDPDDHFPLSKVFGRSSLKNLLKQCPVFADKEYRSRSPCQGPRQGTFNRKVSLK